jgi:hypothetical protein
LEKTRPGTVGERIWLFLRMGEIPSVRLRRTYVPNNG